MIELAVCRQQLRSRNGLHGNEQSFQFDSLRSEVFLPIRISFLMIFLDFNGEDFSLCRFFGSNLQSFREIHDMILNDRFGKVVLSKLQQ